MYLLAIRDDGDRASGDPVPVEVVPFLIGRDPDADLVLTDLAVSARHAQLEVHEGERLLLRDLGSTNGTWLDGRRIEGGVWLTVPASFRVGGVTCTIDRADAPAAASTSGTDTIVATPAVAGAGDPARADARVTDGPPASPPSPPPTADVPASAAPPPSRPVGSAAPAPAAAASTAMPQILRRSLVALLAVGALEVFGGLLAFVLSGSEDIGDATAEALQTAGTISLVGGALQIVFAAGAWRRNAIAAILAVVLGIGLGFVALADVVALFDAESGNIGLAVLRLSLNVVGALGVIVERAWYGRWGDRSPG